jgi:hypothetical protein
MAHANSLDFFAALAGGPRSPQSPVGFPASRRREETMLWWLRGTARDPHSDAERQAVHDAFCDGTHPFDYVENMFHRKGLPTRAKIIELHTAWLEGGTPVVLDANS